MIPYAVINLFNWIKLVTQHSAANHSVLFQCSIAVFTMASTPDGMNKFENPLVSLYNQMLKGDEPDVPILRIWNIDTNTFYLYTGLKVVCCEFENGQTFAKALPTKCTYIEENKYLWPNKMKVQKVFCLATVILCIKRPHSRIPSICLFLALLNS